MAQATKPMIDTSSVDILNPADTKVALRALLQTTAQEIAQKNWDIVGGGGGIVAQTIPNFGPAQPLVIEAVNSTVPLLQVSEDSCILITHEAYLSAQARQDVYKRLRERTAASKAEAAASRLTAA